MDRHEPSPISPRRAVVTGAAGFLGANLVRRLLRDGRSVVAVLRTSTDAWRLPHDNPALQLYRCELTTGAPSTYAHLGRASVVYHLAASGVDQRSARIDAMVNLNVSGTLGALQLAHEVGAERFVYVGSGVEYGPALRAKEDRCLSPTTAYAGSKAAGWLLAQACGRQTGLDVVGLRPFAVYGPFEAAYRLVPYCILRALAGKTLDVTDGRQTRDYILVEDIIDGMVLAGHVPGVGGRVFNLSSGRSTSVRDVVTMIARLLGAESSIRLGTHSHHATELWESSGDPSQAASDLGWVARTTLEPGLLTTIRWFKEHQASFARQYSQD
jgi:nucleoside-diphosphate-sugar epimerase